MKKRSRKRSAGARFRRFILKSILLFLIISVGSVLIYRFVPIYYTPLMAIRSIEKKQEQKTTHFQKKWIPIEQMSPNIIQAVVASEDNLFLQHNGFSIDDIKKVLENKSDKKRIRGASTITQQTAKNVFLWPKRSWIRKGLEAYFTVLIEFIWDKKRIMEVYLNVIEMGDEVYGIEAASKHYFKKSASNLSKWESASIAVCLPNPRVYHPVNKSNYIQKRTNHIVNLMGKIGPIDIDKPREIKKK